MNQDLITVVVPVYNVERYLDRCIQSIVEQTYGKLDILLIDDGSTDSSSQRCDEWKKKDNRIRVIHKRNAGLGMARNTGIENAIGSYICFFDSDDYIAPHTIEKVYAAIVEEGAEIAVFGAYTVTGEGVVLACDLPEANTYQGDAVTKDFLLQLLGADPVSGHESNIPFSAWSGLFSVELIRRTQWSFVSEREIISEDIYSLLALYKDVQKVVVVADCLYFYCQNEGSLTKVYRQDRYARNRYFYEKCIELCRACGYSAEIERRCIEPFLRNVIGVMKQEVVQYASARDAVNGLKLMIDDDVLQHAVWTKKNDRLNLKKSLLYWSIRRKCYWICYVFLTGRNLIKNS